MVELIVVMTIILILAGLITGAAQKAKQRAMVAQAKAMISGLETALGMFQADEGDYPPSGIDKLYSALTSTANLATYGLSTVNWAGPYMNFKQGDVNASNQIVDSWSHPYTYNKPGADHTGTGGPNNTTYLDIWSNGPDNVSGNADDATNWSR